MSKHNRNRRKFRPRPAKLISDKDMDKIKRTAARAFENDPCALCGDPPFAVATFYPFPALNRKLLAPEGKQQVFLFPLCLDCIEQPDAKDQLDAVVVRYAESLAVREDLN